MKMPEDAYKKSGDWKVRGGERTEIVEHGKIQMCKFLHDTETIDPNALSDVGVLFVFSRSCFLFFSFSSRFLLVFLFLFGQIFWIFKVSGPKVVINTTTLLSFFFTYIKLHIRCRGRGTWPGNQPCWQLSAAAACFGTHRRECQSSQCPASPHVSSLRPSEIRNDRESV